MYLQSIFELTMILDSEKFYKLLNRGHICSEYVDGNKIKLVDQSLSSKGITVTYHDKQYKKKVQLTVNANFLLNDDKPNKHNAEKLIRKLEKHVNKYFGTAYTLDDFDISKMYFATDMDVGEQVSAYIKVLQRVGKVKGFSLPRDNWLDGYIGFCLEGNSNGIEFAIYDLERLLKERALDVTDDSKELKALAKKSKGLLRVEIRVAKSTAIRAYTGETLTTDQISALCAYGQKVFLEVFQRIIPFGDFYKKQKTSEIIRDKITDAKTRRRMLRLVALAPEKKSLLLAQKALNYRRIDDIMEAFADIEVSPVTISKRHDVKHLKNLYSFI